MSRPAPRGNLTPVDDAGGLTIYYDEDSGTYHTWCDDGAYDPASTAVVFAVASILGVETDELDPLSTAVEPDALDALVRHWRRSDDPASGGAISFPFAACTVTVRSSGEIAIDPTGANANPDPRPNDPVADR